MHKLVFSHSQNVTEDIKTFWFKPADQYFYLPGQYTFVRVPHPDMDNRGDTRLLSFFSSITEDAVGFAVKFCENGSTYKQALVRLKPGDTILTAEPMGDFVLPKDPQVPLLFVSAGVGSAPVRSIIKWLMDTGEQRPVQMLYAARSSADLAFLPTFICYPMTFTPILTQPNPTWRGETGHLDAQRVMKLATITPQTLIFISGTSDFVDEIASGLEATGTPGQRIIRDAFTGYPQL
jgi:glycine betaine catabolism B